MGLIEIKKDEKLDADDVKKAIIILRGFADYCRSYPSKFKGESFANKFLVTGIGSTIYELQNRMDCIIDDPELMKDILES